MLAPKLSICQFKFMFHMFLPNPPLSTISGTIFRCMSFQSRPTPRFLPLKPCRRTCIVERLASFAFAADPSCRYHIEQLYIYHHKLFKNRLLALRKINCRFLYTRKQLRLRTSTRLMEIHLVQSHDNWPLQRWAG